MEKFEEYVLEGDVPTELLAQPNQLTVHRVYFDKDTREVIAITNEEFLGYDTYFEMDSVEVTELLEKNSRLFDYQIVFETEGRPVLALKSNQDVIALFLKNIEEVDHWNYEFTIEKYPLLKQWGFQLRPDKKIKLKNTGTNISLDFFIVNNLNHNLIIRTITLNLQDLFSSEKLFMPFELASEELEDLRVYTKPFFKTYGFRILYDTDN